MPKRKSTSKKKKKRSSSSKKGVKRLVSRPKKKRGAGLRRKTKKKVRLTSKGRKSLSRKKPRLKPPKEISKKKKAEPVQKEKELHNFRVAIGEERRKRRRDPDAPEGANLGQDYTLDRTAMKIYLTQIEHIPLLTPEEEISLAKKIHSHGRHASQARQKMIRSNLRLVISIAKRYNHMGLPFSDLVEEGNIGLMRAVEKFNPDRGYRFSTYASWWIKQGIMRALSNQGKTIRIPVYMYDIIAKWRRVRDGLMQKLNRIPTRKEIAEIMEVPVNKVKEIENITGKPSSLNAPISLDGTAELVDILPEDEKRSPEVKLEEILKNERVHSLLEKLDDREKRILILRFGLSQYEPHTLEEVAKEFDVTRERVRQIEAVALSKIRVMFLENKENVADYLNS